LVGNVSDVAEYAPRGMKDRFLALLGIHALTKERHSPMAQKVHIVLEDDIDGGEATETIVFGLDGTSYEIDLNKKNAAALRDALAPYVGHGRRQTASRARSRRPASSSGSKHSAREVRDWARANGFKVTDRGRVAREVQEAFDAAH
jgi:hypothetical protein